MYKLFIANKNYSSWSLRAWVLMRVCGIPFEEHITPFPARGKTETFRAFSPTGKVPCLHHDGRVVWDTLAIAEYLAEKHSGLWPVEEEARVWARCAAAEMHSGFPELRARCSMNCGVRVDVNEPSDELAEDLARIDALWTEGLARFGGPFLAGAAFGVVDAFFVPVAFRVQTYNLKLSGVAQSYVTRLLALPEVREWEEAALRERWRDEAHDVEMLRTGKLLTDLRLPPE